jgi:hypothetical protein
MVFTVLLTVLLVALATSAPVSAAETDGAETTKWAITVSDELRETGLSELLTAGLSQRDDVELVERDAIDDVLRELRLNASGLVDPTPAMRFGQLASAAVLVYIEPVAGTRPELLRARVTETRTGVRLLDGLVPHAGLEENAAALMDLLEHAGAKLRVPSGDRRYVSVLGLRNEEPAETITPLARRLTALLEHDLKRAPSVVVLEREQLHRLTAERDLTGIELKLRGATVLIEGGLRRDGEGLSVTISLKSFRGAAPQIKKVAVPTPDLQTARQAVFEAAAKVVGATARKHADFRPREEAAVFARRRDWLNSLRRHIDAARMAEAALALDPSRDNYERASRTYGAVANHHNYEADRLKDVGTRKHDPSKLDRSAAMYLDGLQAARRMHEIDLEMIAKTPTGDPEQHWQMAFNVFDPRIETPHGGDREPHRRLRAEVDLLRLEKYIALMTAKRAANRPVLLLLLERLEYATYFAEDAAQFCDAIRRLHAEFAREIDSLPAPADRRRWRSEYFSTLIEQIAQSREAAIKRRTPHPHRGGEWTVQGLELLWTMLSTDSDPLVRLCGLYGLTALRDDRGQRAARAAIDLLLQVPADARLLRPADFLIRGCIVRFRGTGDAARILESALKRAEQTGDMSVLTRAPYCVGGLLDQAEPDQALDFIRRIRELLADRSFHGLEAAQVSMIRTAIMYRLQRIEHGGFHPPDATTGKLAGAWADYTVTEIPIVQPRGYNQLIGAEPDLQHDELLLAWRQQREEVSIERMGIRGGPMRRVGPNVPHNWRFGVGTSLVIVNELHAIFVASGAPGVAMLCDGKAYFFGQDDGAPGTKVHAIAWLDGALYVTFPNSLARFDPDQSKFALLASAHAVQPQNPLDGGDEYFIRNLLADPLRKCLWLTVDDRPDPQRHGIWKYIPESGTFERVFDPGGGYELSNLTWTNSERESIFFCAASHIRRKTINGVLSDQPPPPSRWLQLDPHTGTVEELAGYAPFRVSRAGRPQRARFLKLNDHIIDVHGHLYTPDGGEHVLSRRAPWGMLKHFGRGFMAADFNASVGKIWRFEPKRDAGTTASQPEP